MNASINEFDQVGRNLWKRNGKHYRLFAKGVTPNDCWLIAPFMQELTDIETATGNDVYGSDKVEFDVTGTVQAPREFVKY